MSQEVWADLLAAHLTRAEHPGSVVVLHPQPRLWPLAEWRAPLVWVHERPLHGTDFHPLAGRHPIPRERLHPARDAAVLAEHLRRADLRLLVVAQEAAATARLAACVPAAQWAARGLLLGPAEAPGWAALEALLAAAWQPLPLPGLRALASPDVAAALAAAGLPLAPHTRWGLAEARRLAEGLPAARLTWPATPAQPHLTLTAEGVQALVCTAPGHVAHVLHQHHAVVGPGGQAQLWLPYEGLGGGEFDLLPLQGGGLDAALLRQGRALPPVRWQRLVRAQEAGRTLHVPAGGAAALLQLALPPAALPLRRFCALRGVRWTVALEGAAC